MYTWFVRLLCKEIVSTSSLPCTLLISAHPSPLGVALFLRPCSRRGPGPSLLRGGEPDAVVVGRLIGSGRLCFQEVARSDAVGQLGEGIRRLGGEKVRTLCMCSLARDPGTSL